MNQAQWAMETKLGTLYLVASPKGLQGVYWSRKGIPFANSLGEARPEVRILAQAVSELQEYFSGTRRDFEVPLDAAGTPFQKQVWEQLRRIPYGETCSYRDLAECLKKPAALRAVGAANGKNPLCIIVPCHRVIASDGTLGGYSGGLAIKARLLEGERDLRR